LYVPNSFTPNGDGINDIWQPIVYDTRAYELFVFDRWGQVILRSTDETASWDGTIDGVLADQGIYIWQIHYIENTSELPAIVRGHFSLIK